MAVDGAEIMKAQGGKKLIFDKGVANAVLNALKGVVQPFPHARHFAQHVGHILFHAQPAAAHAQAGKLLGQRADIPGNGHAVVIENHHERRIQTARIVQSFIAHAAGHSPIPDHCDDLVFLALHIPRPCQAHGGRNGGGGMAGIESVKRAFLAARKTAYAVYLAQGRKTFSASRQQLMRVALVPHVENQLVPGAVKHAVQGDRQFHCAKIGCQMAAVFRHGADDLCPDLARQRFQLVFRQRFERGRRIDVR